MISRMSYNRACHAMGICPGKNPNYTKREIEQITDCDYWCEVCPMQKGCHIWESEQGGDA